MEGVASSIDVGRDFLLGEGRVDGRVSRSFSVVKREFVNVSGI